MLNRHPVASRMSYPPLYMPSPIYRGEGYSMRGCSQGRPTVAVLGETALHPSDIYKPHTYDPQTIYLSLVNHILMFTSYHYYITRDAQMYQTRHENLPGALAKYYELLIIDKKNRAENSAPLFILSLHPSAFGCLLCGQNKYEQNCQRALRIFLTMNH